MGLLIDFLNNLFYQIFIHIFATMDKSRINDMVDRKITEAFRNGVSIGAVKSDLIVRMNNFKKTIIKDNVDIASLYDKEFSDIPQIRHRYGITYIKQCEKRLKDLDWILANKYKFSHFPNSKIFKLVQFKEKISQNTTTV
jgi:hypothetical protein